MGKTQTTAITLDASSLDAPLAYLYNVDCELLARKATQAERLSGVAQTVSNQTVRMADLTETLEDEPSIADLEAWAASLVEAVAQYRSEAETTLYKETYGSDSVDDLLAARETIVKSIEATASILVQLGVIGEAPAIPAAPGKGTRASSRGVKVSGAQYWCEYNGKRRVMAASQNTLSSLCFYHGAALLGLEKGDKVPTAQFRQAIVNAGGTPDSSAAWSVELPGGRVGMDVNEG